MNILISGGTGLVGKELGKTLAAAGHTIFVATRNKDKSHLNAPYPHTPYSWDELKGGSLGQELFSKLDGVIHLAGAGIADQKWSNSYKKKLISSRIETTKTLCDLTNQFGKNIKCFISTSAVGFYGDTQSKVCTENSPAGTDFLAQLCSEWESACQVQSSTRKVIFRIGVVLSKKGGALEKILPPLQSGFGGHLGSGKQFMSWIDIDDLIAAYIFAFTSKINGTFNLVAPHPETNKNFTQKLAKHLKKSARIPVPAFALKILLGEMSQVVLFGQNVSSQKLKDVGFDFQCKKLEHSFKKMF